nr:MAG TPA: hypothetical protein [Caudoviricetes sp.]
MVNHSPGASLLQNLFTCCQIQQTQQVCEI